MALALVVPGIAVAGGPSEAREIAPPGSVSPSIHYEDAQRHAADRIAFTPGDPVSVPFRPRPGDAWPVDGVAPQALPGPQASAGDTIGSPYDGATGSPLIAVKPGGLRREVLGFLPYWELGDPELRLDYRALSTIAYFAVAADRYGHLVRKDSDGTASVGWGGWASSAMSNVINNAHANGTRVVLTVERFSWTSGQTSDTVALLSSSAARQALANETAQAVRDRGADGVNLDFEPIPSGQSANFVAFVRQVRATLDAKAKGYQLTFDATGSIGNYDVAALTASGAADAVLIMGYDYRGSGSGHAGSIDPLNGPLYDLTDTVNAYLARTSPGKIILGVPYYGRAWSTVSDAPNAATLPQNSSNGYSTSAVYDQAASLAAQYGRRWDSLELSPWTAYHRTNCSGCPTVWRELYYDDAISLGLRYDLVNRKTLRGAGVWALGYDGTRPELYATLKAKFIDDTTPPRAGVLPLPQAMSDEGFSVSWSAVDDFTGVAWYDVQVSTDGGAWAGWRSRTTATSGTFIGQQGHGYAFRVRAADGRGNVGAFTIGDVYVASPTLKPGGFARVVTDQLNVRAAPDTSATLVMQVGKGTLMRLTAGPVSGDGLSWYQVTLPLTSWGPLGDPEAGVWVAAGASGVPYIGAVRPPNSSLVNAAITGFSFSGAGTASLGPTGAAYRTFTPNGDGRGDTLRVDWTDRRAFDSMTLDVFRTDGSLVGPVYLGARGSGPQRYDWPGAVGATRLPSGTYLLRLTGSDASGAYHAPSAQPVDAAQIARFGVALHHVGLDRLAGADRYATAAAISAATFAPGVPVAYVASGTSFPDALTAGATAGKQRGPVLLSTRDALPTSTAAELARLKPGRIIVVGGPTVVGDAVRSALARYTSGGVTRLAGADRYATAAAISAATFAPGVPVAYVVNGLGFPDGLAAASAGTRTGGPVLLTPATVLAPTTAAELTRLKPARIVVVGGPTMVSDAVKAALASYTAGSVTRAAGADRYATAATLSAQTYAPSPVVYVATGLAFPDALAAAPLGGPLLLVPATTLPDAVRREAVRLGALRIVVLGGPSSVSNTVAEALRTALGG